MGSLMGQSVNPVTAQPMVGTGTQNQFFQALFGTGLGMNSDNFGYINGVPGYGGQLSPDPTQTLLPQVASNWSPWNAGTGYIADWLGKGGGTPDPSIKTAQSNMAQYGGIGGYPTQLMSGMAQYGGTGGPGNQAMSSLLQFGAPSAAGQAVKDISQTGTSGSWGDMLKARAYGQPSPAMNFISPFLSAGPYKSNWQAR